MLNRDTPLYDAGLVSIEASGWRTTQASPADYPPLQEDQETDVLVVGAGLAGASLALHLAEAGVNVAILEARQPGWGASGRNAGHVLPLLKNLEVFKNFADGGRAFLEQFREHHQLPFTLSTRLGIDCDAAPVGYLHALRSKRAFTRFSHHAEGQAQQLGQRVQRLGGDEMHRLTGTRAYPYGVLHDAGGRINPYRFTLGLIASVRQLGASVFGNSEALALSRAGQRWRVETAKASILCDRVVFCTNAYATDIVPELARCYYPLTAYALTTKPLPVELREIIMPGRAVLAQAPVDLNPLVVDGHHRLITASIPSGRHPADAAWHFRHHLRWLRRTWPETQSAGIELEHYWTGRVALRDQEFPGIYEVQPGVYGLMHFNAWGNVMAPLLGMLLAQALVEDRLDRLPFPIGRPQAVKYSGRQSLLIRRFLIPAARIAQTLGAI